MLNKYELEALDNCRFFWHREHSTMQKICSYVFYHIVNFIHQNNTGLLNVIFVEDVYNDINYHSVDHFSAMCGYNLNFQCGANNEWTSRDGSIRIMFHLINVNLINNIQHTLLLNSADNWFISTSEKQIKFLEDFNIGQGFRNTIIYFNEEDINEFK